MSRLLTTKTKMTGNYEVDVDSQTIIKIQITRKTKQNKTKNWRLFETLNHPRMFVLLSNNYKIDKEENVSRFKLVYELCVGEKHHMYIRRGHIKIMLNMVHEEEKNKLQQE